MPNETLFKPPDPIYCALCGAHPYEQGEGDSGDRAIIEQAKKILDLYKRLQELEEKGI